MIPSNFIVLKVVELLNNAQTNPNDNERIESLKIVQETVLHKVIYFPVMFTGVYIFYMGSKISGWR